MQVTDPHTYVLEIVARRVVATLISAQADDPDEWLAGLRAALLEQASRDRFPDARTEVEARRNIETFCDGVHELIHPGGS